MSDLLDDLRDEFLREYLRHMYKRPVGPGTARYRWAADWWR